MTSPQPAPVYSSEGLTLSVEDYTLTFYESSDMSNPVSTIQHNKNVNPEGGHFNLIEFSFTYKHNYDNRGTTKNYTIVYGDACGRTDEALMEITFDCIGLCA